MSSAVKARLLRFRYWLADLAVVTVNTVFNQTTLYLSFMIMKVSIIIVPTSYDVRMS